MKPEELKQKIAKGEPMELLDIRESSEFEKGEKVLGSKNIPMGQLFVDASENKLLKDKKIITICRSGGRCQVVVRELSKKGYDIDYLEGGINEWSR